MAQSTREDVGRAMRAILGELASRARTHLHDDWLDGHWVEILERSGAERAFTEILTRWSAHSDRPLVLLIDEIDALVGDSLVAVLRQLRSGYDKRPTAFPQTVVLCGVRDVRDYRIHCAHSQAIITGGSAFNIKAESIRLGNFTAADVVELYRQHTAETGQSFSPEALALIWDLTRGQPWLVNALGYQLCFRDPTTRDRAVTNTA